MSKQRLQQYSDNLALLPGDWNHHFVDANGLRFHVAEAGSGPLILLLHGFPEFWGTWTHQIPALANAGYRVVAADLRGYGASDKPPRGYDAYTMAADIVGLVRALGERQAHVVGHDLGGILAFAAASFHPQQFQSLTIVSAAHPLRQRAALAVDPRGQLAASKHLLAFQLPRYDRRLIADDAAQIGRLMGRWSGRQWRETEDFREHVRLCRNMMQIPQAAFCALEAFRWPFRTSVGLAGRRFVKLIQQPFDVPTLQLHGDSDTCVLPRTAQGSGRYVTNTYEWRLIRGCGHFPQRERPEQLSKEILDWVNQNA
ncbi:alpha/beta fold hydrolase [Haloglycomyces albus]|uniref:alpha/beta fold hydrolase n=1 Tax=Haloglycomyces albus TaxID=526067 RepID=UPI00046D154A|nr:alpha/beta hydrolase [Haloglycomyces albus]